ncbi:MAG: hypothetical protein QQN63_08230 [Nitrosopumilus sp.]
MIFGAVIGVILGALGIYLIGRYSKKVRISLSKPRIGQSQSIIKISDIERIRGEVKTLTVEKELLAGSITRVYEAEAENRISKGEREILSRKYSDQLKIVEEKLGNVSLVIELSDLQELRHELVGLFENKLGQIDSRLKEARIKIDMEEKPGALEVPLEKERVVRPKEVVSDIGKLPIKVKVKDDSGVDQKADALREEVLKALATLEQMDIER